MTRDHGLPSEIVVVKHTSVGLSTSQAPARPNRAARRDRKKPQRPMHKSLQRAMPQVAILPGLPGSLYPYVSQEAKEAFAEEHLDALATMHPGMMWRAQAVTREIPLGIPAYQPIRVRNVRETAPDGLGQGVVLGEFTTEPERPASRLILPGKDRDAVRRKIIWPGHDV